MTHLVRQNAFTIDLDNLLSQTDEETGKLPDIKTSRVSILPRRLFSLSFCPSIKNLNDFEVEIRSEATLQYMIKHIQKCLKENNIQVLSLAVNPPITHLKISAGISLNSLPLLLVYLPSVKVLTIPSNENISLSSLLSYKNLQQLNIRDKHIFFDSGEKNKIIQDPQTHKIHIYLSGSRYRFFYPSAQNLKYLWMLIFGSTLLHLYHFSKMLPQQLEIKTHFPDEISNKRPSFQPSFVTSLAFPLITTALLIWAFLYELEKYRARQREVIRETKIEKQH